MSFLCRAVGFLFEPRRFFSLFVVGVMDYLNSLLCSNSKQQNTFFSEVGGGHFLPATILSPSNPGFYALCNLQL
jgi:hypothetical protein